MGRRPTKPGSIPRLRERKRGNTTYYLYDTGGKPRKEIPLGTDYGLAILEYAKLKKSRVSQALTQTVWNFARENGYTSLANPCSGVKGNKETGRDIYVEDDVLARAYQHADQPLRDALGLFYLTGQRVADTLKLDERDIKDGKLSVQQGKTGAKRRIEIIGELKIVID